MPEDSFDAVPPDKHLTLFNQVNARWMKTIDDDDYDDDDDDVLLRLKNSEYDIGSRNSIMVRTYWSLPPGK